MVLERIVLQDVALARVLGVADTDRSWSRDGDVFIPKEEISRRRNFSSCKFFCLCLWVGHFCCGILEGTSLDTLDIEGSWMLLFVRVGDCGMDFLLIADWLGRASVMKCHQSGLVSRLSFSVHSRHMMSCIHIRYPTSKLLSIAIIPPPWIQRASLAFLASRLCLVNFIFVFCLLYSSLLIS
jgi:hypothetical protein